MKSVEWFGVGNYKKDRKHRRVMKNKVITLEIDPVDRELLWVGEASFRL